MDAEMQAIKSRAESNTHRIDTLEERMSRNEQLVESVAVLTNEMRHVKDDMTEVKKDVKILVDADSKAYKDIKAKLLWLLLGGLIAYAINTMVGGSVI